MGPRFARFEEGLKIITHLLQSDTPLDFSGAYYQLHEAVLLPRPQRPADSHQRQRPQANSTVGGKICPGVERGLFGWDQALLCHKPDG
ncbi:MAG: hypothetical protein L6R45_15130 [Anaerolineae bacterium]|nr:hypothetical protein [Anaerolineae bacterium]